MTVTQNDYGSNEHNKKHWGPERHVVINREPGRSLGFSIVGGNVDVYNGVSGKYENISGIFIKNITPDSPADRTNKLKAGDRIIEVDGMNLGNSTHGHAVELIQIAGNPVHLLVQSIECFGTGDDVPSVPSRRKSRNTDHRIYNGNRPTSICDEMKSPTTAQSQMSSHYRPDTPEVIQEGVPRSGNSIRRNITTPKAENATGVDDGQQDRVTNQRKSIRAKAPQPPSGSKPLNQIPEKVTDNARNATEMEKRKYSSEESSEDEDTRHMEGNVYTKGGMEISRKSAGNVKRSAAEIAADPEEEDEFGYTMQKIQKKYKALSGKVLMVKVDKTGRGLGISLAGHKDRSKMAVFICGLNPSGTAFKTGGFSVGDEVLEVNGHVVQNRCHLNASSVIKSIPGTVFKIIVVRKPANINDLAVKPITQFPSALEEDVASQFSQYKGVRALPVKKGQYGLGIMIIEGKHAEVGQGIFVSDIQEGSAAEQAGLQVGDLILAVNFDCLLGSNYDEATALLKKAEGVVTLTVCNPNQKKVAQEEEEKAKKGESGNENGDDASDPAKAAAPKEPEKPKEPEPPADPKDCKILEGKETTIEFKREADQPIGFDVIGGSNTPLVGVFILDVYADGAAGKDGRLKPGDQIIDYNHQNFKSIEHDAARSAVLKTTGVITAIVFRDEKQSEEIEVDLQSKPGRGVGLCITGFASTQGAYVSEVVAGSSAAENGKFLRGDRIVSVAEENVREATVEDIAVLMKGLTAVKLKLARCKTTRT